MSTLREIKTFFAPLLTRNPEFSFERRWCFLKPVTHVSWAISIMTSNDEFFQLHWGASAMFIPGMTLSTISRRISYEKGCWTRNIENIEAEIKKSVEDQCLRFLPNDPNLVDLYNFRSDITLGNDTSFYDLFEPYGIFYYSAQGQVGKAREMCENLIRKVGDCPRETWDEPPRVAVRDLYPLLRAGDRKGIGALLRFHEERCIKGHRLEKLWRPAPYPVELQG